MSRRSSPSAGAVEPRLDRPDPRERPPPPSPAEARGRPARTHTVQSQVIGRRREQRRDLPRRTGRRSTLITLERGQIRRRGNRPPAPSPRNPAGSRFAMVTSRCRQQAPTGTLRTRARALPPPSAKWEGALRLRLGDSDQALIVSYHRRFRPSPSRASTISADRAWDPLSFTGREEGASWPVPSTFWCRTIIDVRRMAIARHSSTRNRSYSIPRGRQC